MDGSPSRTAGADPTPREPRALLLQEHVVVLAASILLVAIGVVAEGRASDASSRRAERIVDEQRRAALTEELLRDAYVVRAPAALRWSLATTRAGALPAEVAATGDPEAAVRAGDFLIADQVADRVTGALAAPLAEHDFDVVSYLRAGIVDADASFAVADLADVERSEGSAFRLRVALVVVTLVVASAGVAKLLTPSRSASLLSVCWVVLAVGAAYLTVEVIR